MADFTRTMLRESRHCPQCAQNFPIGRLDPGLVGGGGGRTQRRTGWSRPPGVEQALSDMPYVDIKRKDNGRGCRFTNTAVPRFDGTGCWQQHILIFQAIGKSNGCSPVTAALQLFAHLDEEALNVALLMPVKERERWEDLSKGLSE